MIIHFSVTDDSVRSLAINLRTPGHKYSVFHITDRQGTKPKALYRFVPKIKSSDLLVLGQTDPQQCVYFQFHNMTVQCNIELFRGKRGNTALQFPLVTSKSYNPLDFEKVCHQFLLSLMSSLLFPTINLSQIQLIAENVVSLITCCMCPISYCPGMCRCGFIFRKWSYPL